MKRISLWSVCVTIFAILFAFCGSASAFLDDNSTNADASVTGVVATASPSLTVNNNSPEQRAETSMQSYGHGYRGFPIQGQVTYPVLPAHFAGSDPDHRFQSLKTITIYKDTFTVAELEEMKKNNSSWLGLDKHVKINVNIFAKAEGDATDKIQLFINKPAGDVQLLGYVTAFGDDEDAVSIDVMEELALACVAANGNAIHATGEGIDKFLLSSGWGIALGGNMASLSDSEKTGMAGFMGIGYSTGQAQYVGKPWIQAFILKVKK